MTKQTLRIFIALSAILSLCWQTTTVDARSLASATSTEYYIVYSDNYDDGSGADLFITSTNSTYGTVEIPGIGFSQGFTVLANTITTVDIPLAAEVQGSDIIANLGIRVTANDDITAYFLNPGEPVYTNDAYVALPVASLGTEYIIMAWQETVGNEGPSELAIVSPFNNVTVTIVPTIDTGSRAAGIPYTVSLDQFQTYTLQSDGLLEDLTGTIIQSSAPIAVFSGNRCTFIPQGSFACDHIVEQMIPTNVWGKHYVTFPLASRSGGDFIRILASKDSTTINIDGATAMAVSSAMQGAEEYTSIGDPTGRPTDAGERSTYAQSVVTTDDIQLIELGSVNLNRGEFYELVATDSLEITANEPVLVAQYATSQDYDGTVGDPDMMLVVPAEQFLSSYTFLTPTGYQANFINIVAPTSADTSLILDGVLVDSSNFSAIGSSGFSGASIALSEGSHTIQGSAPFGIYVYGFGTYVSYGYPGGLGLRTINPPPLPEDHLPIILIPGFGGTRLENDDGEVWLDIEEMCDDATDSNGWRPGSEFLDVLQLNESGNGPLNPNDPHFASVRASTVLTRVTANCDLGFFGGGIHPINMDVYQGLVEHFEQQGYVLGKDLALFGYDWRRDIRESSAQLDAFIDQYRNGGKVNLVVHSMGGMVARQFILNADQASKVDNLIILGTPLLGTPLSFKGLYFGDDFGINERAHDSGLPGFSWLINEERIRQIVSNWPGLYQFLPSKRFFDVYEQGYVHEERDIDEDGTTHNNLDYSATKTFLNRLFNDLLIDKAEQVHVAEFDGFDHGTNGVKVTILVGIGFGTRQSIRFWQDTKWGGLQKIDHTSWWYGNGDNLTPQHSLDLQDDDSDYSGDVRIYYVHAEHGALPTNPHVLGQITQILMGNFDPVNDNVATSPDKWPLDGYWVEVNSPVELHIYDELGNHLGPTEGGVIEYGIRNALYDVVGHDKSAFVPQGINYTLTLTGTDEGEFDLKIRNVQTGTISNTVFYNDISVITDTVAMVSLDPVDSYSMSIDREGDGAIDDYIAPSTILDTEASVDNVPPSTTIGVTGTRNRLGDYVGNVTISMSAVDNSGGVGIEGIGYSLDGGTTVETYTAPFVIDVNAVKVVYAKAVDKAGNEESPLASEILESPKTAGDCNNDQVVNVADATSVALEFFDGDENHSPADTLNGTFVGSPACDANQDDAIDVADAICVGLIYFNGPNACGSVNRASVSEQPLMSLSDSVPVQPGQDVVLPLHILTNGADISGLFFTLNYDETTLHFDPGDSNADGIPDAIVLNLPSSFGASIRVDERDNEGELDFVILDLSSSPASLKDGVLLTIKLKATDSPHTEDATIGFRQDPAASFSNSLGQTILGETNDGSVLFVPLENPVSESEIYLPFARQIK